VGVFGAGDLVTERVQIRGLGESTLSLTGWRLLDENGNEFIFPQLTLFGDGAIDIYTGAGRDTVVSLFWQLGEPVWNQGETVTLADQDGSIQATFSLP
jgi:hypothetical protein